MIVLDTHAWVWFVDDPRRLSTPARQAVKHAVSERSLYISSISAWEVAMLVARGRLKLTIDVHDWISKCEGLPFFSFVPVDNPIFLRSVFLRGSLHADPADRIILATALMMGAPIVTRDQKIRKYRQVKSIW